MAEKKKLSDEAAQPAPSKHDALTFVAHSPVEQRVRRKIRPSVSRVHADVFANQPDSFFDHRTYGVFHGNQKDYELVRYIDFGKFSNVFEAISVKTGESCIVKVLRTTPMEQIKREVRMLEYLRDGPNIITFHEVIQDPFSRNFSFVFEQVVTKDLYGLLSGLKDLEIRFYMRELLKAIDFFHSKGVMHLDLKPNNLVIDHHRHILRVIDFGQAEFYRPKKKYCLKVGTLNFKAPELLVGYKMYNYSVDMWAYGCILASMVFFKYPFFKGEDDVSQLNGITKVLGTSSFVDYISKYNITLNLQVERALGIHDEVPWDSFVSPQNFHLVSVFAFDLLSKLLRFDHSDRISAGAAMNHPYFLPLINGLSPWNKRE